MQNNNKNILMLIILIIIILKSCQIYLDSDFKYKEDFVNQSVNKSVNKYPDYKKLLDNIDKVVSKNNKIEIISTNPPIFTIDNFLTRKESDHLIYLYNNKLKKNPKNNNTNILLNNNLDASLYNIVNQISKLIMVPTDNAHPINIQKISHYSKNVNKSRHDSILHESGRSQDQVIYSIKGFLNNFEGGEVKLDEINKIIKPKKGKIIVICNCQDKTKIRHEDSKYSYSPVKSGSEYLFDLQFNENIYDIKKEFEIKKQILILKSNEKIAKQKYNKIKDKAYSDYNDILKEGLDEFNNIVDKALKLQNDYGINGSNEYQELMDETKAIRDQIIH